MSFARYAKRTDKSQQEIVEAIRKAGWAAWIIGWPCDVLCYRPDKGFRTLECKTPSTKSGKPRARKDQPKQDAFVQLTGTPRVTTPIEALQALGETVKG